MSRPALLLLALALQGCVVHKVRVESEPPGAVVRVDGKVRGVTPVEFTVPWTPPLTKRYNMRVSLPGYRSAEALREAWYLPSPLRRQVRMWRYLLHPFRLRQIFGRAPRTTLRYVMVPEHGPAGTWEPEDVR